MLKDQLLVRSLDAYAAYLPKAFDEENFAFYGTVLVGHAGAGGALEARRSTSPPARCSDDVSKLYVARYFPPETKAAADELVKNVIAAMDRRIDKLDWMAPETKVKAHAKLAAFTPKIGYPEPVARHSALADRPRRPARQRDARQPRSTMTYNLDKLGKPIYRWEWGMTPMTINAYANFGMVEIVFPAAILQPPFFDPNADPAVNYGGIGAVIGHELSHHFDDQGAQVRRDRQADRLVDAAGRRRVQRADSTQLGKQYDAYEPLPGHARPGQADDGRECRRPRRPDRRL